MRVVLVERLSLSAPSRLDELAALAHTMDYEIVGSLQQSRGPDPAYQIGKGKVTELAELVKTTKSDRVIFANQLTPSQSFKLNRLVGVDVIDRFQLILEIFAMRVGTPEAKLQVEYARLSYELPRIRARVKSLVSVEHPGLKGGGEYEVDVHYDVVKRKLANLRKKLSSLAKNREQLRKHRHRRGFKLVALAGYTNSGKSTLLNALTVGGAQVDDMYFTTLAPKTRALKASGMILMTDTVGFIDGLPPWLVEAFKATLEEIYLADLVLLVVDGSDPVPELLRKYGASLQVLSQYPVKIVIALNKTDLVEQQDLDQKLQILNSSSSRVVPISALKNSNLETLVDVIRSNI
jgi:GTP-binding protein HflX